MSDLVILTQIAMFVIVGIYAVIQDHQTVRRWAIGVSSILYAGALYGAVFTDLSLRGWPSFFLLVFIALLFVEAVI